MAEISGGTKFEAAMRDMARKVAKPATLRVGFLEEATYPTTSAPKLRAIYSKRKSKGIEGAVKGASGGVSVPMVAAIQEFGAPKVGIPPRPFFRNMIAKHNSEWGPAIAGLLKDNDYDAEVVLRITGEAIAGQLRQSIIDTNAPPLSPVTIARKGFDKPLIDTSHMINSVDYEVNT